MAEVSERGLLPAGGSVLSNSLSHPKYSPSRSERRFDLVTLATCNYDPNRADVLLRDKDDWTLFEVKSSLDKGKEIEDHPALFRAVIPQY